MSLWAVRARRDFPLPVGASTRKSFFSDSEALTADSSWFSRKCGNLWLSKPRSEGFETMGASIFKVFSKALFKDPESSASPVGITHFLHIVSRNVY